MKHWKGEPALAMDKDKSEHEILFEQLWDEFFYEIDLWPQQRIIEQPRFVAIGDWTFRPHLWTYDYVSYPAKVTVEINGQIYKKGGHNSPRGLTRDYAKASIAASQGWVCFSLSSDMINQEWMTAIANTIQSRIKTNQCLEQYERRAPRPPLSHEISR